MNQKRLERNARRALERKQRKLQRRLTRGEAYKTKISIVPFWKRLIICFPGLVFIGFSVWCFAEAVPLLITIAFLLMGIIIILYGIFGNRKTLDSAFDGIDAVITDKLLEAIVDSII